LKKPGADDSALLATLTDTGKLHPSTAFTLGAHIDALFQGTEHSLPLPPDIILDYIYGIAAYKCWSSRKDDIHSVMKSYRTEHYAHIPVLSHKPPSNDSDDAPEPDEPRDTDHPTPASRQRRYTSTRTGDVMAKAMDELNLVLMHLSGTTPEEVANRRKKRMEEEERVAQETSRSKVMEWMKHTDVGGS